MTTLIINTWRTTLLRHLIMLLLSPLAVSLVWLQWTRVWTGGVFLVILGLGSLLPLAAWRLFELRGPWWVIGGGAALLGALLYIFRSAVKLLAPYFPGGVVISVIGAMVWELWHRDVIRRARGTGWYLIEVGKMAAASQRDRGIFAAYWVVGGMVYLFNPADILPLLVAGFTVILLVVLIVEKCKCCACRRLMRG